VQGDPVIALQGDALAGIAPAPRGRALERFLQGAAAIDDAVQATSGRRFAADRKQVLGGGIHVMDGVARIEQNDRR